MTFELKYLNEGISNWSHFKLNNWGLILLINYILIFVFLIRSNRSTYFFLRVSGFFFRYFFKFHLIIWFGNKWNVSNPCSYLFPFQERLPNFYFFFYRSHIRFKWIQYNKNRIRFNDRGRWEAIHRWAGIS